MTKKIKAVKPMYVLSELCDFLIFLMCQCPQKRCGVIINMNFFDDANAVESKEMTCYGLVGFYDTHSNVFVNENKFTPWYLVLNSVQVHNNKKISNYSRERIKSIRFKVIRQVFGFS